jgi:hypothetical protein
MSMTKSPEERARINARRREQYAQDQECQEHTKAMKRRWNRSNPRKKTPEQRARINARRRERYAQDQGYRESAKAVSKLWRESNPETYKEMEQRKYERNKPRYERSGLRRWWCFLGHARRRNIPVTLSREWFMENIRDKPCFYCGEDAHGGVDRKNNSLGYDPGNAVPCCRWCNFIKFTHTVEEMIKHLELMLCHLNSSELYSDGGGI